MASSRDTSNGPDWKDIAQAILAFERNDQMVVSIFLTAGKRGQGVELYMNSIATPAPEQDGAVKRSVSASVTCSATGQRSLESAVLALLYRLDFQLAFSEAHTKEE